MSEAQISNPSRRNFLKGAALTALTLAGNPTGAYAQTEADRNREKEQFILSAIPAEKQIFYQTALTEHKNSLDQTSYGDWLSFLGT